MEPTSTSSFTDLSRRNIAVVIAATTLGAALYLLWSSAIYRVGFPLDDSWIHLTYARNLAVHGEWAFQPGHLSAGSTAPLWTFLLAIGFWLHLGPYVWTFLLGELTLAALALMVEYTVRRLETPYRPSWPWIGLFFIAEWHLQWAALSGMETLLEGLLMTSVIALLLIGSRRYLLLGILAGLSVWVRPDGLTLLGPVALTIISVENGLGGKSRASGKFLLGFAALVAAYLAFNLWLSGSPLPNTFYAKQAEYVAWQARPLFYRLSILLIQLLTGPSLLLLPAVVWTTVKGIRSRRWPLLASMLWCAGYLLLYIQRLPAYQHGRYLMPAMPALFLFGLVGYLDFRHSDLFGRRHWVVQSAWQLSLLLTTLGFYMLGARSYADDVGLIESEMVVTAKWVRQNLPAESLIAAHDIGALGYFDNHQLIDLAGLVSPEVIPFIRDEAKIAAYLNRRKANYLVAFPAFYPVLSRASEPVFTTGGRFAAALGEQNMTVYHWLPGP